MRIPNKFNGYMSDGRRLYPDPATSAIMAKALASAGTASTAAAAIPTAAAIAAPVATTAAATNLGTTAALEAGKQGIIKGGADVMAQQAAQQVATQGAQQAANQGIMNSAGQLTSSYAPTMGVPPGVPPVAPPGVPPGVPPVDQFAAPMGPDYGLNTVLNTNTGTGTGLKLPEVKNTYDFGTSQGLTKSGGVEVGEASLQMPKMSELTTSAAPPSKLMEGFNAAKNFAGDVSTFAKENPLLTTAGIMAAQNLSQPSSGGPAKKSSKGYGGGSGGDFKYGEPSTGRYVPIFEPTPYAVGGPVEQMSAQNAIGSNTGYPMANLQTPVYSNPMVQRPTATNVIAPSVDTGVGTYTGEARMATGGKVNAFEKMMKEDEARRKQADAQARADIEQEARSLAGRAKPYSRTQTTNTPYAAALKELQAMGKKYGIKTVAPEKTNIDLMGDQDQIEYAANGGIMHGLGGYSDGGRLLKGPGDGVSDSIPAVIGNKQPARLADGEFVIPARIVSELGNGSTEAGARKLYAMMERIQKQRGKTVGKGKVAVNSKASKHLPA